MDLPILKVHFKKKKRSAKDLLNDGYVMFLWGFFFPSCFLYKNIYCGYSFDQMGTLKKGSCQFLAKECAQYWLTA